QVSLNTERHLVARGQIAFPVLRVRADRYLRRYGLMRLGVLKKVRNHLCHTFHLGIGQFWINRQAEALTRGLFCYREITRFVAEMLISLLQMQRKRVMQRAADLVGLEMLFEFITARVANDVQMPRALGQIRLARQLQWGVRVQFSISLVDLPAGARP